MIQLCSSGGEEAALGTLLIIPPKKLSPARAEQTAKGVSRELRTLVLSCDPPASREIWNFSHELVEQLEQLDAKRLTVLGIGSGGALAQALAIGYPKLVRRVVLVDSTTRLSPSKISHWIDALERFLPLGLPLRSLSRGFDSRPQLHRLRCPTLVISSGDAAPFERAEANLLTEKIPNAWFMSLAGYPLDAAWQINPALTREMLAFLQVPTKRPQKNLGNS